MKRSLKLRYIISRYITEVRAVFQIGEREIKNKKINKMYFITGITKE